jgi:hypothetical protein
MELANYQIESPTTVALTFKDGRQQIVKAAELNRYVLPADRRRIESAFQLRRSYFKELPKWVQLIIIAVLALSLGVAGVKAAPGVARLLHLAPAVPKVQPKPVSIVAPVPAVKAVSVTPSPSATSTPLVSVTPVAESELEDVVKAPKKLIPKSVDNDIKHVVEQTTQTINSVVGGLLPPAAETAAKLVPKL